MVLNVMCYFFETRCRRLTHAYQNCSLPQTLHQEVELGAMIAFAATKLGKLKGWIAPTNTPTQTSSVLSVLS